jgi:thiamine biosynthesis lipoprotein
MGSYRYLPPVLLIVLILSVVIIRGLGPGTHHYSDSAIMMDTFVEVSVWAPDSGLARSAVKAAMKGLARIDSMFGDGTVSCRSDTALMISDTFAFLVEMSRDVNLKTGGMFDPTVGAVSRLWDFHNAARPPEADSIALALASVGLAGYLAGEECDGRVFDLGGIAKGYAVDLASEKIREMGIESAIINAGGDLNLIGTRTDGEPWRIAIRHPRAAGAFLGYVDVVDAAVATSGDYEKYFIEDSRRYHHIIDPHTGYPGHASNSVTVVAPGSCISDALATGLFLMGPERGLDLVERLDGIEAVFAFASGESIAVSSGLEDNLVRLDAD